MGHEFVMFVGTGEAIICHQCHDQVAGNQYHVVKRRGPQLQWLDRFCLSCWARWTLKRDLILAPTMPPVQLKQLPMSVDDWKND